MRGGSNPWSLSSSAMSVYELPGELGNTLNLSDEGPGGKNFIPESEGNTVPDDSGSDKNPGPGLNGFDFLDKGNNDQGDAPGR